MEGRIAASVLAACLCVRYIGSRRAAFMAVLVRGWVDASVLARNHVTRGKLPEDA